MIIYPADSHTPQPSLAIAQEDHPAAKTHLLFRPKGEKMCLGSWILLGDDWGWLGCMGVSWIDDHRHH